MFFRSLFSRHLAKLPLLIAPTVFFQQKEYKCSFWGSNKKTNSMEERLNIQQINSNKPCEDRYDSRQLINFDAYVAAVYDGHGGWQVVI